MKLSFVLALLSTGLALAAPTPTTAGIPTVPQPYRSGHSVTRREFKRHIDGEPLAGEPVELTRRAEERSESLPEPDSAAHPKHSVTPTPYKRAVEDGISAPEHYEVLAA